jgi:hypothetical protein
MGTLLFSNKFADMYPDDSTLILIRSRCTEEYVHSRIILKEIIQFALSQLDNFLKTCFRCRSVGRKEAKITPSQLFRPARVCM